MDENNDAGWHMEVTTVDGVPHARRVGPGHVVDGSERIVLEVPHGVPVVIKHLHPNAGTPARVVWVDGSVVSAED